MVHLESTNASGLPLPAAFGNHRGTTLPLVVSVARIKHPLNKPWPTIVSFLWLGVGVAMAFVGSASDRTGKPTWWIEPDSGLQRWTTIAIAFIGPVAVIAVRYWLPRFVLITQFIAVALLAINASVDFSRAPGAATVEYAITLAAFLGSVATLAGLPLNHVKSAHIPPLG